TKVFAFDISEEAQRICRIASERNNVSSRIVIGGRCSPEDISSLLSQAKRPFLFMDCEGAELELLCSNRDPNLDGTDILVECHDFVDSTITKRISLRFSDTHNIQMVREQ